MIQSLAHITLLVREYDEAIDFYTRKLGFELVKDTQLTPTKRWVLVRPPADPSGCCLLLAKAANAEQEQYVGNQTGGRVFLFLYTSDFEKDYQRLTDHQIQIVRPPVTEDYGQLAVFADLYGNLIDLIAPSKPAHP